MTTTSTPAKSAAKPAAKAKAVTPTKDAKPTPKAAKSTTGATGPTYTKGEAKYNPRVEHNAVAWEKLQAAIQKGKGSATHAELCKALEEHFLEGKDNHYDFIGYMVRRGCVVVQSTTK